jgi:hypothetical protein
VALHWLLGLIHLEHGDERRALAEFERELASETPGHMYARECCANTWYAIGALHLRKGRTAEAGAAFERTIGRVATHPLARVGLLAPGGEGRLAAAGGAVSEQPRKRPAFNVSIDEALILGAQLSVAGGHAEAARLVDEAMAAAYPGSAGWLLPIEPLLHVSAHAALWAPALARLRNRAS